MWPGFSARFDAQTFLANLLAKMIQAFHVLVRIPAFKLIRRSAMAKLSIWLDIVQVPLLVTVGLLIEHLVIKNGITTHLYSSLSWL